MVVVGGGAPWEAPLGLGLACPLPLPLPFDPWDGQTGGCASRPSLLGVLVAPDLPSILVGYCVVCSLASILPLLDFAPGTDKRLAKSAPADKASV